MSKKAGVRVSLITLWKVVLVSVIVILVGLYFLWDAYEIYSLSMEIFGYLPRRVERTVVLG